MGRALFASRSRLVGGPLPLRASAAYRPLPPQKTSPPNPVHSGSVPFPTTSRAVSTLAPLEYPDRRRGAERWKGGTLASGSESSWDRRGPSVAEAPFEANRFLLRGPAEACIPLSKSPIRL